MRLIKKQNIEDILFFDIETAPADNNFNSDSPLYDAWHYDHMRNVETEQELIELYNSKAALYGEYGRIVCITIGAVRNGEIILKSFAGIDEKQILIDFMESVSKFANNKTYLCGHNIQDFDMPFVMKRCLVHRVELQMLFDTAHLKPWETSTLDTALLWKGTGWKKQSFISVLSALGLPSPKDDISGADVGRIFYEGDIDRIVTYCEKDVIQVVQLIRALRYEEPLKLAENYVAVPEKILTYLFEGGEYTSEVASQLKESLNGMSAEDKKIAIEILNTIPTKAKGKETDITKADIKKLC